MLITIIPKLPMRDKAVTRKFYIEKLGFKDIGKIDFNEYLILHKDNIEIHFFEFKNLNPKENYGQIYIRINEVENLYEQLLDKNVKIHPFGKLQVKSWGQKEFSLLDPDNNLLTFGQSL
ncbi:VOC family protein [Flavobacterium sp. D11R37]|uniref:bleomycin resistance protein n=1 Tax=Flavobacterium coralii TaxID=2838017 RepID=UPI001CA6FC7D|nr:VOC family protein [Flavobacterium coralii]MBY8962843.1 VOC family protein [Flavobacterium coralii]